MPLLYGEGGKAFRRLQEEIIKRHNDLTIFAWEAPRSLNIGALGLFAESPEAFTNSSTFEPFPDDFVDFSVTNKGLRISGDLPLHVVCTKGRDTYQYALFIGTCADIADGGIYLRKLGPKLFYRAVIPDRTSSLAGFGFGDTEFSSTVTMEDIPEYYILIDQNQRSSSHDFLNCALHIPPNLKYNRLELRDAVPQTLWDVTNRVFLKPRSWTAARYPIVIAAILDIMVDHEFLELVLLCDYRSDVSSPICKIFFKGSYPREEEMLFQGRNRNESIYWSQFQFDCPEILQLGNTIERTKGGRRVVISARFEIEKVNVAMITHREDVEMFSLRFDFIVKDDVVKALPIKEN